MAEEVRTYCCSSMKQELTRTCERHPDRRDCGDNVVHRQEDGTYGLMIHDGGRSIYKMRFCPWCGTCLQNAETAPVIVKKIRVSIWSENSYPQVHHAFVLEVEDGFVLNVRASHARGVQRITQEDGVGVLGPSGMETLTLTAIKKPLGEDT